MVLALAGTGPVCGNNLCCEVQGGRFAGGAVFCRTGKAALSYGQSVTLWEERGDRLPVSGAAVFGWLPKNAVRERGRPLAVGDQVPIGADAREVSLAGKGFDQPMERIWRREHPDGRAQVEARPRLNFTPQEFRAFLEDGAGGAQ